MATVVLSAFLTRVSRIDSGCRSPFMDNKAPISQYEAQSRRPRDTGHHGHRCPVNNDQGAASPGRLCFFCQRLEPAISNVPCDHILGVVIYDLPGRLCAAKASNGELKVGELTRYRTEYINPIVKVLKAHPKTAFALVIKPDSLPNLVTKDVEPGELANKPGGQYNKTHNEKKYVTVLGNALKTAGMPSHAIVDTGRNGVQGLREEWGNWCNVNGAGFGLRPGDNTGLELANAFVWVKRDGESDGTSNSSAVRYDSSCGKSDAYKPSPEADTWNQACFEMLLKNAKPSF
ncbi:1, 4-beta cellobiohydrolase [Colletotrichum cereale]|nr:1, 4-beta cellobiohydrolase [Colletotrichum cereale]